MDLGLKRFDVVLVNLDPTIGKEINKMRPAIVVSPEVINEHWSTIFIIPMTKKIRDLGFRLNISFKSKEGQACVDQLRSVNKIRIVKKLGILRKKYRSGLLEICAEMFAE